MINDPNIEGPIVYGKKAGESKPCYIPFSKDSGDKPVIATEQYVDKHCASIEDIIAALDERVKALEGDKPSPTPKHELEKAFITLFKNKEKGFLYDFNHLPSLFADVDSKVQATLGGEVRKVLDLSGNEMHLTCTGEAPILAINNVTGKYYLRFSGKSSLNCSKSLGSEKSLTLITYTTLDFVSKKGYEMYFKIPNTNVEMCCYDRSKFNMRVDSKNFQGTGVKSDRAMLVGSFDCTKKDIAMKADDMWAKVHAPDMFATIPDKPFCIGNSGENGSNGVVGGLYAMIGVVKYWDDISLSPVEDVLRDRSKTTV